MQWSVVAVLLCSVAVNGLPTTGLYCTPDQWEGHQSLSAYVSEPQSAFFQGNSFIAYDATNSRFADFLTYNTNGFEGKLQIVAVYDQEKGGKLYIVDLKTHSCWIQDLQGEFPKSCIPEDAHFIGNSFLGLKGQYAVSSYRAPTENGTAVLTIQPLEGGFFAPIGQLTVQQTGGNDFLTSGFTDITLGITNATVFDVPKDCLDRWEDYDHPIAVPSQEYFIPV